MRIDRTNYELWLIDLLDGTLDKEGRAQLMDFLMQNPDLKKEFEEITGDKEDPFITRMSGDNTVPRFNKKESLKKGLKDLPDSQFDHLCIASLEGDISDDQRNELDELLANDADRKKNFELISRTKLNPPDIKFRNKKKLQRRTLAISPSNRVIVWTSAAAVILILIFLFVTVKPGIKPSQVRIATNQVNYINIPYPGVSKFSPEKMEIRKMRQKENISDNKLHVSVVSPLSYQKVIKVIPDASADSIRIETHIAVVENISLGNSTVKFSPPLDNSLLASNMPEVISDDYAEDSRVGSFIARTLRGKVLKEKTVRDTPLKFYEIVEAGVTGLNKLMGWQIALDEKKDDVGRLKSLYFNSKMVKFNVPVKKEEQEP